jgi:hypothetical protein
MPPSRQLFPPWLGTLDSMGYSSPLPPAIQPLSDEMAGKAGPCQFLKKTSSMKFSLLPGRPRNPGARSA